VGQDAYFRLVRINFAFKIANIMIQPLSYLSYVSYLDTKYDRYDKYDSY